MQKAHTNKDRVPNLVTSISKTDGDVPELGEWALDFEDTIVYVERIICYWSHVLKSAEWNYSLTEWEALALKKSLIKFQPFLEGEHILAIHYHHAALTWSKTFQNVNCWLLTWGTIFSVYPGLHIIHRTGRVHSNIDPILWLCWQVPHKDSPSSDKCAMVDISIGGDLLHNMYSELGPWFEEKLLTVALRFVSALDSLDQDSHAFSLPHVMVDLPDCLSLPVNYQTSSSYSVLVSISNDERFCWTEGYSKDSHFSKVLQGWKESNWSNPHYPQYHYSNDGLVYFEDWHGNNKLCVPESLRTELMAETHNSLTESAHAWYHWSYNQLAATYYWPGMSWDLKCYVSTCDICQKVKPQWHTSVGLQHLLHPIPIPAHPFEVVSMDFIPELPTSQGYDNVLVIVDKLTKYAIFIPTTTTVTEEETAGLFFEHIIKAFRIPWQVITDCDTRWQNDFWKEICCLMGMKRSLTTSYHPQADGQMEVMNEHMSLSQRSLWSPWGVHGLHRDSIGTE